jgi:hypothetical protein
MKRCNESQTNVFVLLGRPDTFLSDTHSAQLRFRRDGRILNMRAKSQPYFALFSVGSLA